MLPEDKATILTQIQAAKGNIQALITMMEAGNHCEIALLQLQSIQADLYTARCLLLLHVLQEVSKTFATITVLKSGALK